VLGSVVAAVGVLTAALSECGETSGVLLSDCAADMRRQEGQLVRSAAGGAFTGIFLCLKDYWHG
jgi:hypothetical protein